MRGSKRKELKRMIKEVIPNITPEDLEQEVKRIKKLYKEAVIDGKLTYKQRKA